MHSLCDLCIDAGDMPTAGRYSREALALGLQEGDAWLRLYCLAGLACVAAGNEDATAAGRRHALSPSGSSTRSASEWSRPTEVRYEGKLTTPLTNTDNYHGGISSFRVMARLWRDRHGAQWSASSSS